MADLIDRAALLDEIQHDIENSGCVNHEREIIDCVRCAPAIDAEPVVRCGECRHSSRIANDVAKMRHCWNGRGSNEARDGFSRVKPDGYCDCGARMDADRVDANGNAPERGEGGV